MLGCPVERRSRLRGFVAVAFYSVFLLLAPFEHHDLLCHLKTPQHCTACNASQLGSDPQTPDIVGDWSLGDAGRLTTTPVRAAGVLLSVRTTGRSPPTLA